MKSNKLKLDDSLFEDQRIERKSIGISHTKTAPKADMCNIKRINVEIIIPEISEREEDSVKNIYGDTPRIDRIDIDDNSNESASSEYEFNSNVKMQKRLFKGSFPVVTSLKIDNDSNMTIKTKRSSKFSLVPQNSNEKVDRSDAKVINGFYEPITRESMFKLESQLSEGNFTIRKLTTPQSSNNYLNKGVFKFDLSIVNNPDHKKTQQVHPHSCKNANAPLFLETRETNLTNMPKFNAQKNNNSKNIECVQTPHQFLPDQIRSMATLSKHSEKSDNNSVHITQVAKIVQTYEVKIERLMQDHKFKISNYKRMLENKDKALSNTKADFEQLKLRHSELEKAFVAQTKLNEHYLNIITSYNDKRIRSDISDTHNNSNLNFLSEATGVSIQMEPLISLKKIGDLQINIDPQNCNVFSHTDTNANERSSRKTAQTPVHKVEIDKFFNGIQKVNVIDNKRNTNMFFNNSNMRFSPHKAKKGLDDEEVVSKSKLNSMISPSKKIKYSAPAHFIGNKTVKHKIQSSKKVKDEIIHVKKRFDGFTTLDFKNSQGFHSNPHDPLIHIKKENIKKTSFVSKIPKSSKNTKKKTDISAGRLDVGTEISNEVNIAFKKGPRTNKPVFRSKLTRLPRNRERFGF